MNVIVIIADSLRIDHVGCFGNDWIQTPQIDRLAAESAAFNHCYSENLPTLPTRTTWWTGRYGFPFRGWQALEPNDVVLPEWLWDQGMETSLITDVYHLHKPGMNYGRGFDEVQFIRGQEYDPFVIDSRIPVDLSRTHKLDGVSDELWRPRFEQYLRNISRWPDWWESDDNHFVAQVCRRGMRWLEEHAGQENLFLWLDCFDPHEPWDPPAPFNRMYQQNHVGADIIDPVAREVDGYLSAAELTNVLGLYAGTVSMVDKWVGEFLECARSLGMFENSLIIFTSDHGEPFGEHGVIRKCRPWLNEELVHVPLIVHHPEFGSGEKIAAITQTVDLMPTVLDTLSLPPAPGMHGHSLLPMMRGKTEDVRQYACSGFHGKQWSVRDHHWSLLVPLSDKERQLYDRVNDHLEQQNLIYEHPDVADEMELALRRFVAELKWE